MHSTDTFDMHSQDPVIGILWAEDDGTVVFDVLGWQDSVPTYGDNGPEPTPGTGRIVRLAIAGAPSGHELAEAYLALVFSPWGERAVIFPCDDREAYLARLAQAADEAGLPVPPALDALDVALYAQPGNFTRVEDLQYLAGEDHEEEATRLGLVPVLG